jgi:ATP-binding cassette subfamily B protein RaxB
MKRKTGRIPVVLQAEHAECGLACLAMVAAAYGAHFDLRTLRVRFNLPSRGLTLADILKASSQMDMAARPLSLELEAIKKIAVPAILHWDFNHFVVLVEVRKGDLVVHDPAIGRRIVPLAEASKSFTGVAIEFVPTSQFRKIREIQPVSFKTLIGDYSDHVRPAIHAILLSVAIQSLVISLPMGLQVAMDRISDGDVSNFVNILCIGLVGVVLVQSIAMMARGLVLSYLGVMLHYRMMLTLFRHLLRLPAEYFAKRSLADVISRFDSLRYIQRLLSQGFLEAVVDGTVAVVVVVVMLGYNAPLAMMIIAGLLLYALIRHLAYDKFYQVQQEVIVRTATFQSHFMETVRGIVTVKLFNRTYARESSWNNLVVSALKSTNETNRWIAGMSMVASTISGLLWIVTIWFCSRSVQAGDMTLGMVVAFVAWQQLLVSRATLLIDKLFDFRMLHLHRGRVADIAEEIAEHDIDVGLSPVQVSGKIELINVSFRFDENSPLILERLNLTIQPGEFVAIVAPSGEGKTTMLKIMLGLLKPTSGEVRIDGIPLEKFGIGAFRESIGVVMQDDQLFAGTMMENIAFFDPRIDQGRIKRAARMAAIDQDIENMPMGYRTLVGDMGAALSGGQRQRILLARALYRDPAMLFLDEATSHLDATREELVNRAVADLGITRIIAAHRKETIQAASRVIRLQRGRIVDSVGTLDVDVGSVAMAANDVRESAL